MIRQKKPDLCISRVPEKTLNAFKKLAEEEFSNDYGMCLKWCFEHATVIYPMLLDIASILNELENRISKLEGSKPKRRIKLLSGKVLEVNR